MELQDKTTTSVKPTVACIRCRGQKLRCDRAVPSCVRCRKQNARCAYPSPPDRKRIAQELSLSRNNLTDADRNDQSKKTSVAEPAKRRRLNDGVEIELNLESGHAEAAALPPTEIGLLLFETYFKRIYNSTLLFHKNIAFHLYLQNGIPDYLLRAIFAQAAIFLKDIGPPYNKHVTTLSIPDIFERSWAWARSASQEVLSHADEPTLLRIQTLQVLHLYYVSQGEVPRAIVHVSLAYEHCKLLGYDRLYEDISPLHVGSPQFDREIERRSFWASWCSFCMVGNNSKVSGLCERVIGLPLPAELDKRGSVQSVTMKLGQEMSTRWQLDTEQKSSSNTNGSSSVSLMAELVRLLGIWNQVQVFVSESGRYSRPERIILLKRLAELLNPVEQFVIVSTADLHSQASLYDESPELLLFICSIYHLNRLLMHASMIPGIAAYSLQSTEFDQRDAHIVLHEATRFAELLNQSVAKGLDISKLMPLTGYGAFVVGIVLAKYNASRLSLRSSEKSVQVPALHSDEMKAVQLVLEVLSFYWKPLRRLVIELDGALNNSNSKHEQFRPRAKSKIALPEDSLMTDKEQVESDGEWWDTGPTSDIWGYYFLS